MAADNELEISIVLDDGSVRKGFVRLQKDGMAAANSIGSAFSSAIIPVTALVAAFQAFSKAKEFLNGAVSAAREADATLQRLNVALATTGRYSDDASKSFQDLATRLQDTTTVSDDAVIAAATLAVTYTKTNAEALKLTETSVNLASVTGQDVDSALQQLAGTLSGSAGRLQKLFPELQKFTEEQLRAGAAIDFFNSRFAGAAAAQVNTFDGRMKQLTNKFDDFLESVGRLVTQSPTVVAIIKFIGEQFGKMTTFFDAFKGQDLIRGPVLGLIAFGQGVAKYCLAPLEMLLNISITVFNALKTGFQAVVASIAGVASDVVGVFAPQSALAQNLKSFTEVADRQMMDFAENTRDSFSKITEDFKITGSVDTFLSDLDRAVNDAAPLTETIKNNTNAAVEGMKEKLTEAQKAIQQAYQNGILNTISAGVSAFTKSLVTGENAFQSFAKAVLGVIGDMAIQIGTTLVGIGIGIDALKTSLMTLTGGVAIAAGLALIAVGGLLKGLSGGGISPASSGAATAGGGGGYIPTEASSVNPSESVKSETGPKVTVNIQGDVLDSRESGLRIVELINDAFNSQGAKVVTA